MFDSQDPFGQRLRGVIVQHRHRPLQDDRPGVDARIDQVDGAARKLDPMFDGLSMGVKPGKSRQERGVDVDDPPFKPAHKRFGQDAHITGEDDPLGAGALDLLGEQVVVLARGRGRKSSTRVSIPKASALATAWAVKRSAMTRTTRTGSSPLSERSAMACILEPRPETRIAIFSGSSRLAGRPKERPSVHAHAHRTPSSP